VGSGQWDKHSSVAIDQAMVNVFPIYFHALLGRRATLTWLLVSVRAQFSCN